MFIFKPDRKKQKENRHQEEQKDMLCISFSVYHCLSLLHMFIFRSELKTQKENRVEQKIKKIVLLNLSHCLSLLHMFTFRSDRETQKENRVERTKESGSFVYRENIYKFSLFSLSFSLSFSSYLYLKARHKKRKEMQEEQTFLVSLSLFIIVLSWCKNKRKSSIESVFLFFSITLSYFFLSYRCSYLDQNKRQYIKRTETKEQRKVVPFFL